MDKQNKTSASDFLVCLALLPLVMAIQGHVFAYGWNRFVVAATGAPQIGTLLAVGLLTVVALLRQSSSKSEDTNAPWARMLGHAGGALLTWGIMAIVWELMA